MATNNEFELFVESFHHDVIDSDDDSGLYTEEQFTEKFLQYLSDISVIEDYDLCRLEGRGFKINAYNNNINTEDNNDFKEGVFFDLFVTIYTGNYSRCLVSKSEIGSYFKKLRTFFTNALRKRYVNIEESNPAFDLADTIYKNRENIAGVRFFILTDGSAKPDSISDDTEGSIRISHHIWDLQRLFRLLSSGNRAEPIEIDVIKEFGAPIACLQMPKDNPQYTSFLAIMPGQMIADLYGKYGPKLLERNIRVFLQMKGKVNKGIRDTIRNNPCMFLAYNNGISCTAEKVKLEKNIAGIPAITWIRDFQIVNGGQTTAAIHYTSFKEKIDISDVFVQVKLTVLKNQQDMDVIVPKISEYANSQNKISESDFASNELYHIEIEKLSRSVWAHAKRGSQLETHWFYERARGQYQVDKDLQSTIRLKRLFSDRNPTNQRFTKTDLGKYENSWEQLPHIVSLGNQKNFRAFVLRQKETGPQLPDKYHFSLIIAKAILFKKTDKIIKTLNFGPYKGNYVTYTVALLSRLTNKKIDLIKIWDEQDLSPALEQFITNLASEVRKKITDSPPGLRNISEWCKKKECWESVQKLKIEIPMSLKAELISEKDVEKRDNRFVRALKDPDAKSLLERVVEDEIINEKIEHSLQ